MTIEELRSAMRRKVVPEEVVPQNVINCLIDEDAEPPKPDTFTFLMRLRALGIGSTDFVNLLEGCGAPDGVVARIKQNPAMNLQGLILTLENSELDSDDYTRMLLTARQVWERTLTLRLEKSETLSHIIDAYDSEDYKAPSGEPEPEEEPEEAPEEEFDEEFDPEYDEDMREMSFTAVFEKINAEIRAGKITPSEPLEDDEENEKSEKIPESAKREPVVEDTDDNEDDNYEAADLSFTAAFDKIKAEKKLAFAAEISENLSEKTVEQPPVLDKALDKTPEKTEERHAKGVLKPEPVEEPEPEPVEEPESVEETEEKPKKRSIDELLKTARQLRRNRIVEEVRDDDDDDDDDDQEEEYDEELDEEDHDDDYDDYDEEDEDDDYNKPESERHGGFNKGAIIWAASGAAILICAGVLIGVTVGKKNNSKSLGYAKDDAEVFQKIAEAYDAETPGGETPSELSPDYSTLFGDLLISGENGSSLGSFSIDTELYSVSEAAISANVIENGTIRELADVTPPEKARFVAAFDEGGKLYALFSGKQSGYVRVSGGKAEYTVKQDGVLTDYEFANGEMRLGTVYTPLFTETFTIEDEDTFLPKAGTAELSVIPAENIIMTETAGYSYGVSVGYSAESGERRDACAVIGNPIAASADGRFALNNTENGLLITTSGKNPEARTTERLLRVAFSKDGGAILEEKSSSGNSENSASESGANTVTLLNSELKPASILSGVPDEISGMWFDGGLLTINGNGNSILRVDCTDPAKPEPLTLKSALGVSAQNSALTLETNGSALVITRYDLENGKAVKLCEYVKELPPEHLATVALGDPKTAVISGAVSGVAYRYHDEVSMVSEYVIFASGLEPNVETLYDDPTGFTAAFVNDGRISAVCGEGVKHLT